MATPYPNVAGKEGKHEKKDNYNFIIPSYGYELNAPSGC
jgi:hypothetical protein